MRMAMMVVLVMAPLVLAVPVLIGVYVYRDARRRGMNAALWTLLALLGPAFSGLILYLLVRGNYAAGSCPRCGESVRREYTVCPACGAKLRPACPGCGYPVEREWTVCPRCARPLEGDWSDVTPPEVRPDRTLPKVLAVIVLVPVVLVIFSLVMFSRTTGGGSSAQTVVEIGDYLAASDHAREVQEWLGTADRVDRAYALRYVEKTGDICVSRYVVYVPCLQESSRVSYGVGSNLFGRVLTLDLDTGPGDPQGGGNCLVLMVNEGSSLPSLRVELRGKKVECQVTDVDWPLELRTADVSLE